MRLIVTEFVSIDGIVEAPGGGEPDYPHQGWVFDHSSDEQGAYKFDEIMESEAMLLGRTTYEGFAAAWPGRSGEFADRMNSQPKYVASATLQGQDLEWENSTVIEGDAIEGIAKLKEQEGGPLLVHGSPTLVQSLLDAGLVDEWRLMVFPIVLGSGKRLFAKTPDKTVLKLAGSRAFESGVVVQTYRPA
jgi:dihydrofolate reductase